VREREHVPGWRALRALRASLRTPWLRRVLALVLTATAMGLAHTLPDPALSTSGRHALGLFALAALFWMTEVIPLYVTSLLILALELIVLVPALTAEGHPGAASHFTGEFFSPITMLFLGGLLLAEAATRHRLDTWLAARVLGLSGGKPTRVLLALIATTAFMSMWMSNTAATAMMLILVVPLVRQLPPEAASFRKAFFLGVPFAASLGGLGTPIGSPPNAIAVSVLSSRGVELSFTAWMAAALPVLAVVLLLLWRLLVHLFPPPATSFRIGLPDTPSSALPAPARALAEGRADRGETFSDRFPSGWEPRLTLVIFGLAVSLWMTSDLTGLSSGVIALLVAIAILAAGLLDARDFRGISWDVLFLVSGGLALGKAVELSGLAAWAGATLSLDALGPDSLLVAFLLTGAALGTFMSHTATTNMVMPLAVSLSASLGDGLGAFVVALVFGCSSSLILPVSTPPNAIAYYSGEIDLRDMARVGATVTALMLLVVWLAARFYWPQLGLGGT
jgi:sodium-dependent dicarboxylate transporter 2/3/5